jgi:hypothetical protein
MGNSFTDIAQLEQAGRNGGRARICLNDTQNQHGV